MPNKELVEYIKKVRKLGYRDEHIIAHLKTNGYPEDLIYRTFEDINRKFDKLLVIMSFLFVLLIVIVFVLLGIFAVGKFREMAANSPCGRANIQFYSINDKSTLCMTSDNTKIMFMVENTGRINISGIRYIITGENGRIEKDIPDIMIDYRQVFPQVVLYDANELGAVKKMEIIPFAGKDFCSGKAVRETQVRQC